jgi:hypothetical protein
MRQLIEAWNRFWFESFDERRFRLFQFIFLTTVFVLYGFRVLDFEFLYTESGILPFSFLSTDILPELYYPGLPLESLAKSAGLGLTVHWIFIALIGLSLFYRNYWFIAFTLYLLHIVFLRRNPLAVYGVDMVATFWFLYSSLINPKTKSQIWSAINSVGYRLIQIQLCIIYAYSGFDKARGLTWWKGDAIWYALGNTQIASIDFSFLAYTPWLLTILAAITVLWETYFPLLIWVPQIRRYVLLIGFGFHLSIAIMMNLYEFSMVMLAAYPLFFDEKLTSKIYAWMSSKPILRKMINS